MYFNHLVLNTQVSFITGVYMIASNPPLVSVVIPAYNAARFIDRTLTSVLSQSYQDFEVLVVDDGSTDETAEILKSTFLEDPRVIFLQKPNGGVASARNLAIRASRGNLIAPLDADDIWYTDKLKEQVTCLLKSDESVGLVYCWSKIVDEGERPIVDIVHRYEGKVFADLMYSNFLGNGSCALIRRSCFDKVGWYNSETTPCEEWDLYLRIAEHYSFRLVPKILVGYREVLTSLSANHKKMERAFAALMHEARCRRPKLPLSMSRVAKSYFYMYLTGKSSRQSHYGTSLIYLAKSVLADPMRFFSTEMYSTLLKLLIRIIAKPVTSRIWQDDRSWRVVKQKLSRKQGSSRIIPSAKAAYANQESERSIRLYDRIHISRMTRFREETRILYG